MNRFMHFMLDKVIAENALNFAKSARWDARFWLIIGLIYGTLALLDISMWGWNGRDGYRYQLASNVFWGILWPVFILFQLWRCWTTGKRVKAARTEYEKYDDSALEETEINA